MNTRTVLVAVAAALAATVPAHAKLKVGDPAPPMQIMKWVKGTPVNTLKKGNLYVIEFWATWCGPCRTSIPHLSELAKKYKGKVTFAGIDVWENDKGAARVASVTKFVTGMGATMAYHVGMDDDIGKMAKSWMAAAGQNGIPTAFVIGKNGRIAWVGHPMEIDKVLGSIVKGTFNARAAAAEREATEAKQAAQQKMLEPVSKAVQANDFKGAVAALDKVFAEQPAIENDLGMAKFQFLLRYDEAAAFTYGRSLTGGLYKDNARNLNALAWMSLDETRGPKNKDYSAIIAIAERANEVATGKDPNVLDTLAKAYAGSGDFEKAIATQEQALAALPKDAPEQMTKQVAAHLAEYKAKKV